MGDRQGKWRGGAHSKQIKFGATFGVDTTAARASALVAAFSTRLI